LALPVTKSPPRYDWVSSKNVSQFDSAVLPATANIHLHKFNEKLSICDQTSIKRFENDKIMKEKKD